MGFLKGRTNRVTFWFSFGIVVLLMVGIAQFAEDPPHVSEFVFVALCVPRLHDVGRSGWWVAGLFLLEAIYVVVAIFAPDELGLQLEGPIALLTLVPVLCLGLVRGEPVANRFGEPPAPGMQWRPKAKDD